MIETLISEHHDSTNAHIDQITLQYKENVTDLTSASEGFSREINRVNALFKELQKEFLLNLEEKRVNNETVLKGLNLNKNQIKSSVKTGT